MIAKTPKKEIDSNSTFRKITSIENIRSAYFDFVKKFDEDIKSKYYRGIDGLTLNNIDFDSEKIIRVIRKEMLEFREIAPAYSVKIPKKKGGARKIFVYTVKERIKAEAVYRVLEPIFDEYLSNFLFSYRKSHPSYFAIRSVVRRYKRRYGNNYIFVTDITDYTDSIKHDTILKKIATLGLDSGTKNILSNFIKVKIIRDGELISNDCGIVSGTPLCGMLSNLLLDEFDKWAGKNTALYRRVGDDIIAIDNNPKVVQKIMNEFIKTTTILGLNINKSKSQIIRDTEEFKFLGYRFAKGLVGFDESSVKKARTLMSSSLGQARNFTLKRKVTKIKNLRLRKVSSPDYEFGRLLDQKSLVDDTGQVINVSNMLMGSIAKFFFGYNNVNKRHRTREILKKLGIRPLAEQYILRARQKWKK